MGWRPTSGVMDGGHSAERGAEAADISQVRASGLGTVRGEGQLRSWAGDVGCTGRTRTVKFGSTRRGCTSRRLCLDQAQVVDEILARGDIVYVKVHSLAPDGTCARLARAGFGRAGALLAIDNASGDVKAMVGGRDFDAVEIQSRYAGAAAGGVVVQAVCVYGCH